MLWFLLHAKAQDMIGLWGLHIVVKKPNTMMISLVAKQGYKSYVTTNVVLKYHIGCVSMQAGLTRPGWHTSLAYLKNWNSLLDQMHADFTRGSVQLILTTPKSYIYLSTMKQDVWNHVSHLVQR